MSAGEYWTFRPPVAWEKECEEEFGAVVGFPPERCAVCFDWRDAFAKVPSPASARQMPERKTARPIRTRRLRNADCEGDFFFIDEIWS